MKVFLNDLFPFLSDTLPDSLFIYWIENVFIIYWATNIICHWGLAVKPAQCYKWFIWINVVGQMWCNHINQHLTNCNILPLKLSFHCFLVSISQCDNKEWGYPGFPEKGSTSKQVSLCSVIEIAVEIAVFSKDNLKINKNGQHFYQRTYKKLFLSNKMMWYIVKGTNFPFL